MTKVQLAVTGILIACSSGIARATPSPPPQLYVSATVETVGVGGLIPAAGAHVDVCRCFEAPTCFGDFQYCSASGVTDSAGNIDNGGSGVYGVPGGTLFVGVVQIDDQTLRGIAVSTREFSDHLTLAIDPVSEAAVEILADYDYSTAQYLALVDVMRQANLRTDFAGLSLANAIARARAIAFADPNVQAALPAWTPTPTSTVTPTATPTPTRTLRPTGTPRACLGDCTQDGRVEVQEVITGVNLVLERVPANDCSAGYPDAPPNVADLVAAVNNALYECPPMSPLADLVAVSIDLQPGPSCYFGDYDPPYNPPLCMSVCIANVGDAAAAPFDISIDDGSRFGWSGRVDNGLAAGDGECNRACLQSFEGSVRVDADGAVEEARERNNLLQFRISTPTPPPRCPPPTPT